MNEIMTNLMHWEQLTFVLCPLSHNYSQFTFTLFFVFFCCVISVLSLLSINYLSLVLFLLKHFITFLFQYCELFLAFIVICLFCVLFLYYLKYCWYFAVEFTAIYRLLKICCLLLGEFFQFKLGHHFSLSFIFIYTLFTSLLYLSLYLFFTPRPLSISLLLIFYSLT